MPGREQGGHRGSPLTKYEVDAIFRRFVRGELGGREETGLVKRLKAGSEVAVPLLLERLQEETGLEQDMAGYLVSVVGGQAAKEALGMIVQDPQASSRARVVALAALRELGEPIEMEALLAGLRDSDSLAREAMESTLAALSSDETTLEAVVQSIEMMPGEERSEFLYLLGFHGDRRALRLLVPLLYAREVATTLAAIEALETLGAAEAVPNLTELSQGSSRPEVRSRARAAYGKLAMKAVSAPGAALQHVQASGWPPQRLPLYKALVTTIDGDGGQCLLVARKERGGRLKAVDIFFNDHQGVKGCLGLDALTIREWGRIVSEVEAGGVSWVEVGLPYCRRILAEARATNVRLRRKLPMELEVWGGLLEDGPEAALLWKEEDLEKTMAGLECEPDLEAVRRSGELLDLPEFASWRFEPRDMEAHCLAALAAMERSRTSKTKRVQILQSLLDDMIKAVVKPRFRALLQDRLRRQAWLLGKLGRTEPTLLALAAAADLARKGGMPLEEQPFVRGMALKSLLDMASLTVEEPPSPVSSRGNASAHPSLGDRPRAVGTVYRLKVSLKGHRRIWRVIEIKGSQTLHKLHEAIFLAFDRYDEHLYAFHLSNNAYDRANGYESPYSEEGGGRNARRARLDSLGLRPRQKFLYVFDFGDEWQHTIEVLDVAEGVAKGRYPRIVDRSGDSPPQYPDIGESVT